MDNKIIFVKTAKGDNEVKDKSGSLSGDLKRALFLVDDKSTFEELEKKAVPSLRAILPEIFRQLVSGGYVRDKAKPFAEAQLATPKIVTPTSGGELDFTGLFRAAPAQKMPTEAERQSASAEADRVKKEAEVMRARAELEAAVEAAKIKARAEAEAKAEANAKLAAEVAAKNKAEADLRAKHDALVREQAEAKAKHETEARMRAEQLAMQAKVQMELAAKAQEQAEALARHQMEVAEQEKSAAAARAKKEAEEVRLKAEQAAAKVQAELEAAAKAQAEAEAARKKAEQEAAAMRAELAAAKAEQEAARVKAELAAAQAKAEAEAKALAEQRAQQAAEAARIKAEQEAARVKAELAAAQAKAEAEAKALAEQRAQQAAEAARIKAEQEAARVKAELAAAQAKAEAEAKALAEQRAQQAAEVATPTASSPDTAPNHLAAFTLDQPPPSVSPIQQVEAVAVTSELSDAKEDHARQEKIRLEENKREAESAAQAAAIRSGEEAQRLSDEQAKTWAAAEQRAKAQAQTEAARSTQAAEIKPAKIIPPKKTIVRRKSLPLGKMAAGLLVLAILLVLLLPYVMPLNSYVAPIEQKLSAQLKQPVHIGALHATLLPLPALKFDQLTVGAGQEIKVANVVATFDPFTLFSEIKVVRNLALNEVTMAGANFDKQLSWLQTVGGNKAYPVTHISVQRIKLLTEEVVLPIFNGEVEIDEQGRVSKSVFNSADAKFEIAIQPIQERWQISLSAKESVLPVLGNVLFDDFSAKGELVTSGVNFVDIKAQAYGGFLNGNAKLTWQKGWQLQGHVEAKSVELQKLFPKFGGSGEVAGEAKFSAVANKLGRLSEVRQMEGSFLVKKGVINGMDMVETARQGSRQALSGGRTHFDELGGAFQASSNGQHFQQVKISSGILNGNGAFDVAVSNQLSGRFSVELKGRGGVSALTLSGSVIEPVLRSAR